MFLSKLKFNSFLLEIILGVLLSLFIFVSFIRGSVTITYIILAFFLIILGYLNKNSFKEKIKEIKKIKKALIFLSLFVVWIIIQPFILSDISLNVLSEVRGQFIVPLLFFMSGIFLVLSDLKFLTSKKIFNIIFFTGFFHVLIIVFMSIIGYFNLGYLPFRTAYILNVNEVSYFTNLIYAMFLAEAYSRLVHKKSFLYIKTYILPIIFLLFLFSIYLQGMRWGVVTFSISTLFFTIMVVSQKKIFLFKKLFLGVLIFFLVSMMVYSNLKKDKRWSSIIETIEIVMNDNSLYWVNKHKYPCPRLKNGECVNLSNYLRLAQVINGFKLLEDYPLGVGYSRRAYQDIIIKIYDDNDESFNFPHSGITNLVVGVGLLGSLLYFLFIFYLINRLLRLEFTYAKIFTVFFVMTFHMRSFVDMIFMNHNLKVFFLILGIGVFTSLINEKVENRD